MTDVELSIEEVEAIVQRAKTCKCFCGNVVLEKEGSWVLVDSIEGITHSLLRCGAWLLANSPQSHDHDAVFAVITSYGFVNGDRWAFDVCTACHSVISGVKAFPHVQ